MNIQYQNDAPVLRGIKVGSKDETDVVLDTERERPAAQLAAHPCSAQLWRPVRSISGLF